MNKPILLVDDDASIRRLCRRMLTKLSFDVVESCNASSALEELETSGGFSMILLDLGLPDLPGTAVATKARSLFPDLPIITFTGGGQSLAGCGLRLSKPFSMDDLRQVTDQALQAVAD